MNDATNRFLNANAVANGKPLQVHTPKDKLTLSDLDARLKRNNSNETNNNEKSTTGGSSTNFRQYLFGSGGSGDEISLSSSINSSLASSSTNNDSPLLKFHNSSGRYDQSIIINNNSSESPSVQLSVSPTNELGTFEPESTNRMFNSMAAKNSPPPELIARKMSSSGISPEEFMWQSYAPGAKTKAVLNQTRKLPTATNTTNSDSNNNNNNNSQDTNNDNNNNNNKVDIDIIDRLDMNNISMTENTVTNTDGMKKSKFGWVSYVPGESGNFVSGDKALKILDDGEASFNSEHKFSLRDSFVASSLNESQKSTNDTKQSVGMIANDHIWGASGASGEGDTFTNNNNSLRNNNNKNKNINNNSVIKMDDNNNNNNNQNKNPIDDNLKISLGMNNINGKSKNGSDVNKRSSRQAWEKDVVNNLPKTNKEKDSVQKYFIERSMPLGNIVNGDATKTNAVRFSDTEAVVVEMEEQKQEEIIKYYPTVEPSGNLELGIIGYDDIAKIPLRIVYNDYDGDISIDVLELKNNNFGTFEIQQAGTYGINDKVYKFQPSKSIFIKSSSYLNRCKSSLIWVIFTPHHHRNNVEGKRKKIKKKNKNKKKPRLPFQFKTGKSNKSISKLTYGKTKAFINIEFTKKRNATHDITKDDEDGDDNDNAITTRLPVHVELAPKNNLQIPPGMNEISLTSCDGQPVTMDLPLRNGGCNVVKFKAQIVPMTNEPRSAFCFNCDISEVSISPFQTDAIRVLYVPYEHMKYAKEVGLNHHQHVVRAKLMLKCTSSNQTHIINLEGCIGQNNNMKQYGYAKMNRNNTKQVGKQPGAANLLNAEHFNKKQVIRCQETGIQFGAVDQGSIAEALFTIHNVVDFDLSVRCRVAHVHLPGKPNVNVFDITSDELIVLPAKGVQHVTIRYKPIANLSSRAFLILTANGSKLKLPIQTRIAIGGCSRKPSKISPPLITQMAKRRQIKGGARTKMRKNNYKSTSLVGRKKRMKSNKKRNGTKKDDYVKAYMLVKSNETSKLNIPFKFNKRDLNFKQILLGKFVTRQLIITNTSKVSCPIVLAVKNKKSPFHILNGLKSIKFELKGNESRTIAIRFKPNQAKSFADSLLAWKNGGGERKVVLLSGKAF